MIPNSPFRSTCLSFPIANPQFLPNSTAMIRGQGLIWGDELPCLGCTGRDLIHNSPFSGTDNFLGAGDTSFLVLPYLEIKTSSVS